MIQVERFIICDGYGCGENFGVDDRGNTGANHRRAAKRNGWTYRNGKDYCPECTIAEAEAREKEGA